LSQALADAVLVLHAAFVLFVVGGLPATWIGVALDKPWAYNRRFRGLHLAAIGFVVVETLLGYMCPLTTWEYALRGESSGQGFIQRYVHAWLYWRAPAWVFAAAYVAFGLLVAATWWRWPPTRGRGRSLPPRGAR
jgi:cytochrome c biogenesis protein CcdA